MNTEERRWYWIYSNNEYCFTDVSTPFGVLRHTHTPEDTLSMHHHNFLEIVLVLTKHAVHVLKLIDGTEYRHHISAGDVLIINPGEWHAFEMEKGDTMDIINIDLTAAFLDSLFQHRDVEARILDFIYQQSQLPLDIRFGNILKLEQADMNKAVELIDAIIREQTNRRIGYQLMMANMMSQVLIIISRKYLEYAGEERFIGSESQDLSRVKGYAGRRPGTPNRFFDKTRSLYQLQQRPADFQQQPGHEQL